MTEIHDQPEVSAIIRRIAALPDAARLQIGAWLIEDQRLGDVSLSPAETLICERDEALNAIRDSARRHQLPAGTWPTTRQFDDPSPNLAVPGWTVARVLRAWGRWSAAITRLRGGRATPTPAQRSAVRHAAGRGTQLESPQEAIRNWLKTQPRRTEWSYRRWASAYNGQPGLERYMPCCATISNRLGIPFGEAVRLVAGEIEPDEVVRTRRPTKKLSPNSPHDLVGRYEAAAILSVSVGGLRTLIHRSDFPHPALAKGNRPMWLRADLEAYRDGRPAEARLRGELDDQYYDSTELAAVLHITPKAIRNTRGEIPPPTTLAAGRYVWYRPTVEQWLRENPPSKHSGRRRHEMRQAAAKSASTLGHECVNAQWCESC